MELRANPGWACQAVCTELCEELGRGRGGASPWCHICSLVASAVCWPHSEVTSAHTPVPADDWLALALQSQSGTSNVTWPPSAADNDGRPWGQCLALLLCSGSAQDELTPSLIAS